jgi:hypothetical protein
VGAQSSASTADTIQWSGIPSFPCRTPFGGDFLKPREESSPDPSRVNRFSG